jgi:hypothetical protein
MGWLANGYGRYVGHPLPIVLLSVAYHRFTGSLFTCTVAALVISIKGIDAALAGFALSFSLDFSGAVMCMTTWPTSFPYIN